jgi:hypothetical protein
MGVRLILPYRHLPLFHRLLRTQNLREQIQNFVVNYLFDRMAGPEVARMKESIRDPASILEKSSKVCVIE